MRQHDLSGNLVGGMRLFLLDAGWRCDVCPAVMMLL